MVDCHGMLYTIHPGQLSLAAPSWTRVGLQAVALAMRHGHDGIPTYSSVALSGR